MCRVVSAALQNEKKKESARSAAVAGGLDRTAGLTAVMQN
jgi:hypothetical protein